MFNKQPLGNPNKNSILSGHLLGKGPEQFWNHSGNFFVDVILIFQPPQQMNIQHQQQQPRQVALLLNFVLRH
jgi:hypothetical protein